MEDKKFNPEHRKKLNDPERLEKLEPGKIWTFIDYKKPERILDIGAGTAFITAALADLMPKALIDAFDIEPVMVEEMRSNLPEYSRITPHLMADNELPVANEYADVVWMINLFHELRKPHLLLKEIKRVLKPNGKLLIIDWAKREDACESGPPLEHRVDEATITSLMVDADFSNIKATEEFTDHLGVLGTKL
ncbi:class I SAM-dependent methyltransferase [Marinilabilia salmonicolor]|uniref:class I SAM-dependent methyltransferase n=1 Tax=Marinilabilia salmonicolor TaxID=989 RepID=UPI000299FAF2|nr:class I SAM-dependent methyltransferase [Marinilabilia salmonicolor]